MKIISDYSDKGVEKTMLVREVILKAIAKVYSWVQGGDVPPPPYIELLLFMPLFQNIRYRLLAAVYSPKTNETCHCYINGYISLFLPLRFSAFHSLKDRYFRILSCARIFP